jgi:hypothetical protein
MKNVKVEVDKKGILTITVDTTKSQGMSASGKTEIIGTTSGNVEVEDSGVFVGLNVYKYPTNK